MMAYRDDPERFSNFHYDMQAKGTVDPPRETIRAEVDYRDFKIKLVHPNEGHLWYVADKDGIKVPAIEGMFTKLPLAYDAINSYLNDIERQKGEIDTKE